VRFGVIVWIFGDCSHDGEEFPVEWSVWEVRKLFQS
jgi:hypothetical protein